MKGILKYTLKQPKTFYPPPCPVVELRSSSDPGCHSLLCVIRLRLSLLVRGLTGTATSGPLTSPDGLPDVANRI